MSQTFEFVILEFVSVWCNAGHILVTRWRLEHVFHYPKKKDATIAALVHHLKWWKKIPRRSRRALASPVPRGGGVVPPSGSTSGSLTTRSSHLQSRPLPCTSSAAAIVGRSRSASPTTGSGGTSSSPMTAFLLPPYFSHSPFIVWLCSLCVELFAIFPSSLGGFDLMHSPLWASSKYTLRYWHDGMPIPLHNNTNNNFNSTAYRKGHSCPSSLNSKFQHVLNWNFEFKFQYPFKSNSSYF
jgi:hypothetical protein